MDYYVNVWTCHKQRDAVLQALTEGGIVIVA